MKLHLKINLTQLGLLIAVAGLLTLAVPGRAETAAKYEAAAKQESAAIDAQVQRLSEELRCLVCQNQTLADSTAPLAEDLRQEIREMAARHMSDRQITDYLVARYGDFVLYRPPFKPQTALLWLGPFLLLVAGLAALGWILYRRNRLRPEADLSKDELSRVAELLNGQ